MAQSPAHQFGQIVGDVLEAAVLPLLGQFARDHGLYLDHKGPRPCRRGTKCTWRDLNGNVHDLDFVLERGGAPNAVGLPAAFIETAWRRYTKHSRNKAQEIQGAIEPLAETYREAGPFKGAVLAGVFTDGALTQLRSLGFSVLYFPYETVITAFRSVGVDAAFDESTPDRAFQRKVKAFSRLSSRQKSRLCRTLVDRETADVRQFIASLSAVVLRQIERILIVVLHGEMHEAATVDDAIRFLQSYADDGAAKPIMRYEIEVRYNNGNTISGSFADQDSAVAFLKRYQRRQSHSLSTP